MLTLLVFLRFPHPQARSIKQRRNTIGQNTIPARCSNQLCPASLLCNSCRRNAHKTFVSFQLQRVVPDTQVPAPRLLLRVEQPDHTSPQHSHEVDHARPAECIAPRENKSSLCSAHLCSRATSRTFIFHSPSCMRQPFSQRFVGILKLTASSFHVRAQEDCPAHSPWPRSRPACPVQAVSVQAIGHQGARCSILVASQLPVSSSIDALATESFARPYYSASASSPESVAIIALFLDPESSESF